MSTSTKRTTAPHPRGSIEHRLARLLDAPSLAQVVPHLAPETLHALIQYRGLEACGALITAATPAQLTSLLDLDLWRHPQPGRDEQFDVERFGAWLEVLIETGDAVAARTVATLDADLVVAGLSRYVRIFDPGTFEPTESSDDEAIDRHALMHSETSGDVLECEVGGYLVRSRRTDAWDAIIALLVALDLERPECFHAVVQGCRGLGNSRPEVDELDDLLLAPEQHLHDVTSARERRRVRHGYASPADARAFLLMARQPRPSGARTNPIAAAYFRGADEDVEGDVALAGAPDPAAATMSAAATDEVITSVGAVTALLAEAGMIPDRSPALLASADGDSQPARLPPLMRLMAFTLDHDDTAYRARARELAFLANTLLAGCSVQSRPFTPQEASDAAASICNLGLECGPTGVPGALPPPEAFLVDHDLVSAFEVGWSVLYRDVSLFVSDHLIATLADLDPDDAETRLELRALRRTLMKQRDAGTPWRARGAAEVLALLDPTAWVGVLGLLDECPILPAALTAVLERRTTSVSATAFRFIATTGQLGDVRLFLRTLPKVLSR